MSKLAKEPSTASPGRDPVRVWMPAACPRSLGGHPWSWRSEDEQHVGGRKRIRVWEEIT